MTHKTKSVGTVPKSNRKIIERGKIDTPKKYTWPHTRYMDFNKRSGGVKLVA